MKTRYGVPAHANGSGWRATWNGNTSIARNAKTPNYKTSPAKTGLVAFSSLALHKQRVRPQHDMANQQGCQTDAGKRPNQISIRTLIHQVWQIPLEDHLLAKFAVNPAEYFDADVVIRR